jgi:hypothetical protein
MAVITWDIAQLERHLPDGNVCPDGAVYTVHYTVSCEESGKTSGAYGSIGLGDPDPSSFTPFNSLTKDQVVDWVKTTLGSEQVAAIEAALEQQIQQELNPTSATGLPW